VLRELISRPISMINSVLDLPRSMQRSVRQANELMDVSQEQLEVMRRQADEALAQAERMNDLLAKLVKLTEPLEKAQRGGEFVSEQLKRVLLGEASEAEADAAVRRVEAEIEAEVEAEVEAETQGGSAGEAEEPPVM
jgi:multidrug efflux pump subunit AcrA (membrane-fusion protein)